MSYGQRNIPAGAANRPSPAFAGQAGLDATGPGRWAYAAARPGLWLLLAAGGAALVAALVERLDAVTVLVGLLALGGVGLVLIYPAMAVALVGFVIYLNVPAILTQRFDVPEMLAGSIILLLGVPLVAHCVLRRERLRGDRAFTLMLVFLGAMLLSSTAAVDQNMALGRVQTYVLEGLVVFWLILNVVRDLPTLRKLMFALLAAGTIVSALSFYQDLTGNYDQDFGGLAYRNYDYARDGSLDALTGDRLERGRFDRAQGPVNEPNRFAQIMIVLVPMAVYLFRTGRTRFYRSTVAVMGVFALIGVVVTLSRGAIIALALMAAAMAALGWIKTSRLAVVAALGIVTVPLFAPFYMARIASLANVQYLIDGDSSTVREADGAMRGRLTEMLAAFSVFLDYPMLGVGPGQFAPYYVQDYSQDPDIQFRDIREARRAHTLYLELAAEEGLVGLTSFMSVVGVLLFRLWRARQVLLARAPGLADLATACWLSILAYLTTAIFLHLSYQRYYWLLLAIAAASLHIVTSEASRRRIGIARGF